jgi:hypothetical protein
MGWHVKPDQVAIRRFPLFVAIALTVSVGLVLILLLGSLVWWRSNPGDVMVPVRNLSAQAITFTTEERGKFFFPETVSHQIQPWHEGICTPTLGLDRGHIKLSVSGSNVAATTSYETTITPDAVQPTIGIEIESDGRVQFGVTIPPDNLPCTGGGF